MADIAYIIVGWIGKNVAQRIIDRFMVTPDGAEYWTFANGDYIIYGGDG